MLDYKKILKSRKLRLEIIELLSFVPDKLMVKIQYYIKTGRRLNLKNPRRFSEKLQWYKLYYKDACMVACVDKYDVRNYVRKNGLEDILIPCYGVYDDVNDIDWDSLPNEFVMKDTLGGGGTSVLIVRDKKSEDIEELKRIAKEWTTQNYRKPSGGREWPYYSGKPHRIIIEELIKSKAENMDARLNVKNELTEYKFFCFNGTPTMLYVIEDRKIGNSAALGIYDISFRRLNVFREDEKPLKRIIKKPDGFEKMKEVASKLSKDFPEVRIDLYYIDGKIKFGEMTFYDGSGYLSFNPDKFDLYLGKKFDLPQERIKK